MEHEGYLGALGAYLLYGAEEEGAERQKEEEEEVRGTEVTAATRALNKDADLAPD